MKLFIAVLFASLYGLSMRLAFGFLGNIMPIMSITFLLLLPMLIGFLTVLLLPRQKVKSNAAAFFLPWLTCLVILFITMLFSIEGMICWIMVFPLFVILAGIGGVLAFSFKQRNTKDNQSDSTQDSNGGNTLSASVVIIIPLIMGLIEGDRTTIPREIIAQKQIQIHASPQEVWQQILRIDTIRQDEHQHKISALIGFPHHVHTTLDSAAVGGVRMAYYERGLYFKETITQYEPGKFMRLAVKTDPYNIPPAVMDEHILIGGKHLDILEDTYQLESAQDGTTRLTLSSKYMINTPLNWYVSMWSSMLMDDVLGNELAIIKHRAEVK